MPIKSCAESILFIKMNKWEIYLFISLGLDLGAVYRIKLEPVMTRKGHSTNAMRSGDQGQANVNK